MATFTVNQPLRGRHWVFLVLAVCWFIYIARDHFHTSMVVFGQDFEVYRSGAGVVFGDLHPGKGLYDYHLENGQPFTLPFTYPPFAVMVFAPFAVLPLWAGTGAMTVLALVAALWVGVLVLNYARARGMRVPGEAFLGSYTLVVLLATLITIAAPWDRGIELGQINPLIFLLVMIDLLRPATRVPRGVLIGIAGGIKLTPLAFGLILLMRKDIKGVVTLGATFAATVAAGFLFMRQEFYDFWFFAVSDPSRVGNIGYVDNISVQGTLLHLGLEAGTALSVARYAVIALLFVGTAAAIPALYRRGMVFSEISLNAFLMLAISPISWSHHFIWLPVFLAALVFDAFPVFFARCSRPVLWGAAGLALVGVAGLVYGPMKLAIKLDPHTHNLDELSSSALLVSALPMVALTMLVLMWLVAIWRYREVAPLQGR
ncbi:MAG: glycosyltransferase 87 family protein [Rothia sp. (in: high G+C Gram-positive bacteria)]|nr:glycosyltransferase 87 family protein [Rothia sp. (in: high G+C Gram-positive bacteria)]